MIQYIYYAFIIDVLIDLSWLVWLNYYLFDFPTST